MLRTTDVISDGNIYRITIIGDGSKVTVYKDGVAYSKTMPTSKPIANHVVYIGYGSENSLSCLMKLYDARFWNKAIDKSSIGAKITGSEDGLIAWYKCAETSGSVLTDSSKNANNGTITGSYSFVNEVRTDVIPNSLFATYGIDNTKTIPTELFATYGKIQANPNNLFATYTDYPNMMFITYGEFVAPYNPNMLFATYSNLPKQPNLLLATYGPKPVVKVIPKVSKMYATIYGHYNETLTSVKVSL